MWYRLKLLLSDPSKIYGFIPHWVLFLQFSFHSWQALAIIYCQSTTCHIFRQKLYLVYWILLPQVCWQSQHFRYPLWFLL